MIDCVRGFLMPTSVVDAVDGSSTGTWVPWMWALLRHDPEERAMQMARNGPADVWRDVCSRRAKRKTC